MKLMHKNYFYILFLLFSISIIGCSEGANKNTNISTKQALPLVKKKKGPLADYLRIKKKSASEIIRIGNHNASTKDLKISSNQKFVEIKGFGFDSLNRKLSKHTYLLVNNVVYACKNGIKNPTATRKFGKAFEMSGFSKMIPVSRLQKGTNEVKVINSNSSGDSIYLPSKTYTFILK